VKRILSMTLAVVATLIICVTVLLAWIAQTLATWSQRIGARR
jgi:hypothetical protein